MAKSFFAKLAGIEEDDTETTVYKDMRDNRDAKPHHDREETVLSKTKFNADAPMSKDAVRDSRIKKPGAGNWLADNVDGQLALDVYQKPDEIIIKSTIAGAKPEDIDVSITNDMVTIRGERSQEDTISNEDYFYQECYWGSFSRSVVLPVEVDADASVATIKNGILTLVLPKAKKNRSISVKVKEE